MTTTALIFVIITSIALVVGWMAINKKDAPRSRRPE
jgi:hypothetical protein